MESSDQRKRGTGAKKENLIRGRYKEEKNEGQVQKVESGHGKLPKRDMRSIGR